MKAAQLKMQLDQNYSENLRRPNQQAQAQEQHHGDKVATICPRLANTQPLKPSQSVSSSLEGPIQQLTECKRWQPVNHFADLSHGTRTLIGYLETDRKSTEARLLHKVQD